MKYNRNQKINQVTEATLVMALYIPSFYLTRGGGQLKLLYRVYAHMV
jgi:hypothetical protein